MASTKTAIQANEGDDIFKLHGKRKGSKRQDSHQKKPFYSNLNMEAISDQDYEHAQQVWNIMIVRGYEKTLGSYHYMSLKTDVMLLPDVFESLCHMDVTMS